MKDDKQYCKKKRRLDNTKKHQNRRIRLANWFGLDGEWWDKRIPGIFRKYNLVCSCHMCSQPKYKRNNKGNRSE